ncbi:hypothetical protein SAMN04488023_10834 [Pedobacter rhizosphaerae]|uniref:Uncharacterized protein n=2 Tax=Pedobacter rhizosphaerae TaxID=390241 RepID=A0A1H9NP66_9SPHI|nr:hypothetical protein SAMN04488023_10834 [Pedobacter rhizosphaerae]
MMVLGRSLPRNGVNFFYIYKMIRLALTLSLIFFISACALASRMDNTVVGSYEVSLNTQQGQERKKQDQKKLDKKTSGHPKPDQPKIKEVPRAKRQIKPMAVKPNVKVKPIKIIKPKIKRP